MTRLQDVAPLALGEFYALSLLRTPEEVTQWTQRNAAKTRKRERHVVELVAAAAAARVLDGSDFYRLELDDDASQVSRLCGRLIASSANRDDATTEALVTVWANEPADVRQAVLWELVARLRGPQHD